MQNELFSHAWSSNIIQKIVEPNSVSNDLAALPKSSIVSDSIEFQDASTTPETVKLTHYQQTVKTDQRSGPRNWRTRKDPFERVWDEIKFKLELNPEMTAKILLDGLIIKYPDDYEANLLRPCKEECLDGVKSSLIKRLD